MPGTLFVVATPIGNLEDISARALRVLREVAVIAAEDTRHTGHLLQRFGVTTRTISFHEHSERGKAEAIVERLRAGESVALVSDAGTPTVSDPGAHLIRLAHSAGIKVEPIPGPSALIAALSACGFDGDGFVFLGFPPTKAGARADWFARLRQSGEISRLAVFYEAPHRIGQTTNDLMAAVGDVEVCVARELTKAHEEIVFGRISTLDLGHGRGEYTVIVNFGQTTSIDRSVAPLTAQQLADEFGQMTTVVGLTRRQAISALSRKYRLSAKHVYAELETAKISGV
jgi:16S rRNA (cytidine1402-2'-O)-methyltransferase